MFIGRQIQDHIKLLMQVTTLKRLEVLAHTSSTFFSLLQSKQQNENISGGDEWFCQNEGDPWYISNEESQPDMTDPWASATGTDIWEMADYPDPFSVCDSTATLLQCHPILENDASLISGTHGNSAVSTALFPDVLSSLSSDSTDSDSCSDYKVHSSSDIDEDSDWEDVTEDSGALRFQFADPVARCWTQSCKVECFQESTYSTSSSLAHWNMYRMTIQGDRNTNGTQHWCVGPDRFFDWVRAEPSILFEDLVDSMPPRRKEHASQANASISADLEFLCLANERCVATNLVILRQVALLETSSCRF